MTIGELFVLEEIKIYSGSTNVSVKKYGSHCSRRWLILENRNSAQDLRRVSVPMVLEKIYLLTWKLFENTSINNQNGAHRANKTLQGNTVQSALWDL